MEKKLSPYNDSFANDIHDQELKKSSQKGLQKGWSRATFILKKEYIDKLKALSYWERTTIKEIIDDALSNYLKDKDVD